MLWTKGIAGHVWMITSRMIAVDLEGVAEAEDGVEGEVVMTMIEVGGHVMVVGVQEGVDQDGPIVAPPALRLPDVLLLPTMCEVPAHLLPVDIVHFPADLALPLIFLVPLVHLRPTAAVSVPRPVPSLALVHHPHPFVDLGRHRLHPHLVIAVTEVEGIAAVLRLEDVVFLPVQIGPFHVVEVARDHLRRAM